MSLICLVYFYAIFSLICLVFVLFVQIATSTLYNRKIKSVFKKKDNAKNAATDVPFKRSLPVDDDPLMEARDADETNINECRPHDDMRDDRIGVVEDVTNEDDHLSAVPEVPSYEEREDDDKYATTDDMDVNDAHNAFVNGMVRANAETKVDEPPKIPAMFLCGIIDCLGQEVEIFN